MKHYEDMESVESLIRSSAANVEMGQQDFLSALRHVYHTNLLSLQEAKKAFRGQMRKMQKVHGI